MTNIVYKIGVNTTIDADFVFSLSAAKRDKPLSKMLEKAKKSVYHQVGIPGL